MPRCHSRHRHPDLLVFRLGRPDVLPLTDYGIRKGIEGISERWRPYRTVASWHLWRSLAPEQFALLLSVEL
ncbi:MAG TPA: hypothetical protein DD435_07540 [Cyanobacteria bacterium UBA8530]|nr:hypothetical protein [Cyanobacteria bacterium UBA8530]